MPTEENQKSLGYFVRHAEEHHIAALNAIELAAAAIFPPGSIPEAVLADRVPLAVLKTAQKENLLWVAVDADDIPVGYLLLEIMEGLPLLAQLDVHPLHGRKGLGTALIAHGIMQLREMGFAEAFLTTFSHVPWNAPFYQRLGFSILDERDIHESLAAILRAERARGLRQRVAMRLAVVPDSPLTAAAPLYKASASRCNCAAHTYEKVVST